jgi:ubiquinone/menaquinone biosynthesis C-methylase UbiE
MTDKNNAVTKTIQTYEELAEEYYRTHFDINEIKNIAEFFIQNLKGKKILDVGCGPGRDAKYFSEHNLEVTGIDLASNFVKMASQNVPNAKFIQMDMRNLDFPENSFDSIWACASFLHIPKSEAKNTLLGFRRVLKPNGLLYISVKQGAEEKFVEKEEYRGKTKFFAFYTEDEFKNLIESCNFKILKIIIDKKKDTWINVFATKNRRRPLRNSPSPSARSGRCTFANAHLT